jgi:hypothetical protein
VLNKKKVELALAKSRAELRLDLACGRSCKEGFEGVDRKILTGGPILDAQGKPTGRNHADVVHAVDLFKFPFPWADSSVEEIFCSHFIEHIPAREVEARDLHDPRKEDQSVLIGKDMLVAFFDECYRILKPDAFMTIVCPSARNERAFQDPTHRRFIVQNTFAYFDATARQAMGIEHYLGGCDFLSQVGWYHSDDITLLSEEARQRRFGAEWNVIWDYNVKAKACKPSRVVSVK